MNSRTNPWSFLPSASQIGRFATWILPALLPAASAQAVTYIWDANGGSAGTGGTGNWDTTTALWDNAGLVAWPTAGTDNDALFDGTAGTVTLTTGISVNDLTFNLDGYSILGNTLTLNGTTPTLTVGAGLGATLGSTVAGSAGLTKAGAGTLTLTALNNPYTGATTVGAGTLSLSGSTLRSTVNVTAGSTLRVTGGQGLVGQYNAWTGSGGGNFNSLSALNNRFSSLTPALQYNGSTDASGNFDFASNGSKSAPALAGSPPSRDAGSAPTRLRATAATPSSPPATTAPCCGSTGSSW
ncbi:MAG: autotransporter-associated beta strand repeat-containing protein [Kiritimatiellia bacterium]